MIPVSQIQYESILTIAPSFGMRNICLSFAQDFETFRQSCQWPFAEENFTAKFEKYESMHYAPLFDFVSRPYSRNTTRALLFVAGGYLTIPTVVSTEAIEFGIRLCSHLFFTQPEQREYKQVGFPVNTRQRNEESDDEEQDDDDEDVDEDDLPFSQIMATRNNKRKKLPVKKVTKHNFTSPASIEQDLIAECDPGVELFHDQLLIDRIAKIPIAVDVALHLVSLCQSRILSDEAIQHFKLLKEHGAFSVSCAGRGVRYGDVSIWAIHVAHQRIITSRQLPQHQNRGKNGKVAAEKPGQFRSLFPNVDEKNRSSIELMMEKLNLIEMSTNKNENPEGADEDKEQDSLETENLDINAALQSYQELKQESGYHELFDDDDEEEQFCKKPADKKENQKVVTKEKDEGLYDDW